MIPPIANRFVAGEHPATALEHARRLGERDVAAIFNLLGEHYDDREPAREDTIEYLRLIDDIASEGLEACVSVKPTQLGLAVGEDVFRELLEDVVAHGADRDVFVWIDMEDHTTTDATLDAFESVAREYDGGVGVCVQANLKRTREDVRRLADVPGKVRFTKGAYDEPPEIAYQEKAVVDRELKALLEFAFENFEGEVAVGSHDPEMIEHATALYEECGTAFEIQMLMGVREEEQFDLASEYDVYQYVPYGDRWKSYFYRRVMERTENLTFAARAILGR